MPAPPYGSPSPYPDSPAAFSPLTISNSDRKTEDRTLSTDIKTYSPPLFERRDFFLFQQQKSDKLSVAVDKVLSLFLFVEFEIICDSAGWMRAENTWIQTAECTFRRAGEEILGDLGAEFSKTKTPDAGVRIFNGSVRAEREFPLKILFLACIRGFSVLLYSAERRAKSPRPHYEYDFRFLCIRVFSYLLQSHVPDKFKFSRADILL